MSDRADLAAQYIHAVLAAYRRSPHALGRVRPADRRLAATLHRTGVPLQTVQDALLLGAARRQAGGASVEPIRSLYYFCPVIEELMRQPLPPGYADYLRQRLPAAEAPEGPLHAGPENDAS
ncbi:MAG: hypothetical protein ACRD1P_11315 [Thermoanaerobaculia bacterium]